MGKTKVFIVEDHPIMRRGLAGLIHESTDFEVCGEAQNLTEARLNIKAAQANIVLLDISLPDGNGFTLLKEFRKTDPGIKFIVLTMHNEMPFVNSAMELGASGYLVKDLAPEQLIETLRGVKENLRSFVFHTKSEIRDDIDGPRDLSEREAAVYQHLQQGLSLEGVD